MRHDIVTSPFVLIILSLLLSNALSANAQSSSALTITQVELTSPWQEIRDQVINPDDYECSNNSELGDWLAARTPQVGYGEGEIPPEAIGFLSDFGVFDWPILYTIYSDADDTDDYIGLSGEHTYELVKRHKDNKRFWDVDTKNVKLHGMHGSVIADTEKMVPLLTAILIVEFGLPLVEAQNLAAAVVPSAQNLVETHFGFDHPIFTFNAAAFGGEIGNPFVGTVPPKIIMGDGLLQAYDEINLGDVAPDFIHAHEFAHQIQFSLGVFGEGPPTPEDTRRTELMADAFGAYYATHARGATFQAKRFADVMNAAYEVGDCGFSSPSHHGTPNQREAATVWGQEAASSFGGDKKGKRRGKVISAQVLVDMFDEDLNVLIAPDAIGD